MSLHRYLNFENFFQALCHISAISLVIFCVHKFIQDEDLTEISFKRFLDDEESIYPEISLCLSEPYRKENLKALGDGINSSAYNDFLHGELWDDRMLDINYHKVTLDIKEYLIDTASTGKENEE